MHGKPDEAWRRLGEAALRHRDPNVYPARAEARQAVPASRHLNFWAKSTRTRGRGDCAGQRRRQSSTPK